MSLEWRKNSAGGWAWFDGSWQVTGATYEIGADRPHAVLDANGDGLETACGALPGETVAAYVLRVHGLTPREEPDALPVTIATHPEFARLHATYGHLTLPEIDALLDTMGANIRDLLAQHVREFNGMGGRRYGPAMATQAGREQGEERLLLSTYRDWRRVL